MTKKRSLWIMTFLTPSALLFLVVFAAPLLFVFITSFTKFKGVGIPHFTGLDNYKNLLFHDKEFLAALKNTFVWIVLQALIHVPFGVLVGLILFKKPFGWKFVRNSYVLTIIIPSSAFTMLFILAMNPQMGVINTIIKTIGFHHFGVNWLGDSTYAFYAVTSIWLFYSPIIMLFTLAELGSIPTSIFESAKMDGASNFQIDRYITLPLLKNILGTCLILSTLAMVTEFDSIFLTTRGGPGTTTLNLPLYLYKTANLQMDFGVANTIGVFQIALGLVLVFIIGRIFQIGHSYH